MDIKKINAGDSAQEVSDIVYENDLLLNAALYESIMESNSLVIKAGTSVKPKLLEYYVYYSDSLTYTGGINKYKSCKFKCPENTSLRIEGVFNANVIPVLYFDRYMKLIDNVPLGTTGSPLEVNTPKGTEYIAINIYDYYDKLLSVTFLNETILSNNNFGWDDIVGKKIPAGYDISRMLGCHLYNKDNHGFITPSGAYTPNELPPMYATDFIPIVKGKTLNYKVNLFNTNTCIAFYDRNKCLVRANGGEGFVTGSIVGGHDDIEYIRLSAQQKYAMYIWYEDDIDFSDLFDSQLGNPYANISAANIVSNKYMGLNKLTFGEYEDLTEPSDTVSSKVDVKYMQSTNKRFKNAVFITPETTELSFYYTNIKSILGDLNVGDQINTGYFAYIKSEQHSIKLGVYSSLSNTISNYIKIATNKWVFIPTQEVVTELNKNDKFRIGFYILPNTILENIEMTGLYAYVNNDINEYIPHYNDILGQEAFFDKTLNSIVNYIDGKDPSNLVRYCEFNSERPALEGSLGLDIEYKKSSKLDFINSVFLTPTSTRYYYFIGDNDLKSLINIGDKIKVGFWMKITADSDSKRIVRLYNGIDNYASNHQNVKPNEWEYYLKEYEINEISTQELRFGIYVDRTPIDIEEIEITGLTFYINKDINTYQPYYEPIINKAQIYTDNTIEKLKSDEDFSSPIIEKAVKDSVDFIEGKSNSNVLKYCELENNIPYVAKLNGEFEIKNSSDERFKNAVFYTPGNTTEAGYIFTADGPKGQAYEYIKEGDNIRAGFWCRINSSTLNSITIYGLYYGFNDTIAENSIKVNTNEWVFIQRNQAITIDNINRQFRCGFYFTSGNLANIDSVELTAFHLYVNKTISYYTPYYTTIEQRLKTYTNEQIEQKLTKSNGIKGANISRFLAKVWSKHSSFNDTYRQPSIKVSMIGDSIVNSIQGSLSKIENILAEQYPGVQFEYKHIPLGGMRAAQMMPAVWEVINWNPDLVIYGEWEDYKQSWNDRHYWESIVRLFRDYSQTDIALFAHSIVNPSAEFLANNNIQGYLTDIYSQTPKVRSTFMAIAKKYNCEFMDFQQPLIEGLLDGTYTVNQILKDFVHPTDVSCNVWGKVMKQHFVPIWENESYGQITGSETQKTYYLQEAVTVSDIPQFSTTGTWGQNNDSDMLKSEADNSTVELHSESCAGWQLVYKNTGKKFDILIDGKKPSTILSEYTTQPSGNHFAKFQKVQVSGNVLTDLQSERKFKLVVTSASRNSADKNKLTALTYNIVDKSTSMVLKANCNAFEDTMVNVGNGSLTIPYKYAGQINIIDSGYDPNYPEPENGNFIKVGNEFEFSVLKNYYDTLVTDNDNSIGIVDLFPLKRGNHSIKIIAENGVELDSLMEF